MTGKPGRTLGLSLAIIASVILFSILPLMQVGTVLLLRARFEAASLTVDEQNQNIAPLAVGGSYTGVDESALIVQTVLGVAFLGIAFFAWRGKPAWIRFVMLASVVVLTLVTVGFSILPLLSQPDINQGFDSGAGIRDVLLSGRLLLSILVALYVVWYVNRGPARAYYRGYYLPNPDGTSVPPR
jgi:cytochrome bd-type quinol oxidase subunit 2